MFLEILSKEDSDKLELLERSVSECKLMYEQAGKRLESFLGELGKKYSLRTGDRLSSVIRIERAPLSLDIDIDINNKKDIYNGQEA